MKVLYPYNYLVFYIMKEKTMNMNKMMEKVDRILLENQKRVYIICAVVSVISLSIIVVCSL